MKNTREKVLEALATLQIASVQDLAAHVAVNPITIRHHLNNLEAQDLVTRSEQRHGVGRPRMIYRLTSQGSERFPANFKRLTENLLSSIETLYGPDAPTDALNLVGKRMADTYRHQITNNNLEEKMTDLSRLLSKEGYQIEWELQDNIVTIYNSSCPYHHLNKSNPEICQLGQSFFSEILEKQITFQECDPDKNNKCTFKFEV